MIPRKIYSVDPEGRWKNHIGNAMDWRSFVKTLYHHSEKAEIVSVEENEDNSVIKVEVEYTLGADKRRANYRVEAW